MAYLNQIHLIGSTGRDAEFRVSQTGRKFAGLSLATSRNYVGDDGARKEVTQWHTIVCWGKLAEIVEKLDVKKGTLLYVSGEMTYRKYTGRDGTERTCAEVNASSLQILTPRSAQADAAHGRAPDRSYSPQSSATAAPRPARSAEDDDLPF
jgi:single-strand DNA-binding protein